MVFFLVGKYFDLPKFTKSIEKFVEKLYYQHMKKKVFFFLYCVLMIGGLVLFLIFSPKFIDDNTLKDNKTPTENNQSYATKIKLNCEDDIVLAVGSSVELKQGYISVEPSNKLKDVKITLTKKSGADNGVNFANDTITATNEGKYLLTFSVLKSSSTEIFDTLTISVVAKEDDNKVKLLNNNFTANTTVNLNEMFAIDAGYEIDSIQNNEHLTCANNQITFNNVGNTNLKLNLNTNYLTYKYNFDVLIKPQITSGIVITGEINGILEIEAEVGEYFEISYYLRNESGEYVVQNAEATMSIVGVVDDLQVFAPIITGKVIIKTSVKIIITPTDTSIAIKEINVIFK